jgi:hypothetical protein
MQANFALGRASLAAGAMCIALGSALGAQAQGKLATDDMWEVTTKMEVAGNQAATPAQTKQVCLARGLKAESYIPRREECKVTDTERSGSKLTYKMVCTGKDPMIASGEITTGPKSYEGKMSMSGMQDGQTMKMTQTFSGKLIGECASSK